MSLAKNNKIVAYERVNTIAISNIYQKSNAIKAVSACNNPLVLSVYKCCGNVFLIVIYAKDLLISPRLKLITWEQKEMCEKNQIVFECS